MRAPPHLLRALTATRSVCQGMWAALLQAPISRFGDTAANAGMLALLEATCSALRCPAQPLGPTAWLMRVRGAQGVDWLPLGLKTFCASTAAGVHPRCARARVRRARLSRCRLRAQRSSAF